MDNLEKAKYIVRRLQEIFPESSAVIRLTAEEVIKKCNDDENTINFYVLAVRKERYCEKVC